VGIEYYFNDNYHQWAAPISPCFAIRYTTYSPEQPGINEYDEPAVANNPIRLHVSPNPFHHLTDIRYQIPDNGSQNNEEGANLRIYDASGKLVRDFGQISVIGHQLSVRWYGDDNAGRKLPNGIYFARVEADEMSAAAKIILVQ
jgi:hypothetical protein